MQSKQCSKCKQIKPVIEFFKHHQHGYQYWCKECVREYHRKYRKTPKRRIINKYYSELRKFNGKNKEYSQRPEVKKRKAAQMRAYREDPNLRLRHKARRLIRHLVSSGCMIKPKNCSRCNGTKKIQAHHPDYSKPLMVIWLCHICHIKVGNKTNRILIA